jgi:CheY-like chemotaxis protein
MSITRKYSFFMDSQTLATDRSPRHCNLNVDQTICAGHIQFCENFDALRKKILDQKSKEGLNNKKEEGHKNNSSHYRALVVDDEESMRKFILASLSKEGHQCITAGNGIEALHEIRQNEVDVVITDMLMPEMDGITLTKEILSLYPHLPIMVITGHSKEYSAESAIAAGARDFIEKPFSIEEFLLRLSKMMRDYEILCQMKVKQNQMVFRLSKRSLEEINELKREIESLKSRLCSVYTGSWQ